MRWRAKGTAERGVRYVRRIVVSILLAAFAATLGTLSWPPERISNDVVKSAASPLLNAEGLGYDALLAAQGQRREFIDDNIVVVGIDSNDEKTLGHGWPFPRDVQAAAIRNLANDGARVIAYDVLLDTGSDSPANKKLDQALADAGNVVLTTRIDRGTSNMRRKTLTSLYHSDKSGIDFEAHTRTGFAEIPLSHDGHVRSFSPVLTVQDELYPSFPLAVYMAANKVSDGELEILPEEIVAGSLHIPRTGSTAPDPYDQTAIPSVRVGYPAGASAFPMPASFSQVAMKEFTPGTFRGKIVFVGLSGYQLAKEFGEQYETAYSRFKPEVVSGSVQNSYVPGVVLQALHFNALLRHTYIRDAPDVTVWIVGFAFTLGAITLVRRFSNLLGLLLVVFCGCSMFGLAWMCLHYSGMHLPWVIPMLMMFASAAGVGWLESGTIKRKWAGYVSPAVLDQILKSDGNLGASRYEATVMFGDIRGFTSFSEGHSPEAVVHVLNLHLEKLTRVISEEHGTIDKFLGDGILAAFGAPIPFETSAISAVRAAWRMRKAALDPVRDAEGNAHVLATGFGIATGPFLGGDVGSKQLRNWTIIGDVVNLASRLQGVTGEPDVIIDSATLALVKKHAVVESLGAVTLKGKAQPVECYKVVAWSDQPILEGPSPAPVKDAVGTR